MTKTTLNAHDSGTAAKRDADQLKLTAALEANVAAKEAKADELVKVRAEMEALQNEFNQLLKIQIAILQGTFTGELPTHYGERQ